LAALAIVPSWDITSSYQAHVNEWRPLGAGLGMTFPTSWIINESLIICADANNTFSTVSRTGRISWSSFEQMTLSSRHRGFRAKVVTLQYWLAISALVVHTVILNGALRVVFRKLRLSSSASWSNRPRIDYFRSPSGTIVSARAIFLSSVSMIGLFSSYSFILRRLGLMLHGLLAFMHFNTFLLLVSTALNFCIVNVTGNTSYSAGNVFGFTSFGLVAIFTFVSLLSSCSVMLGENLFVVFPGRNENSPSIDHGRYLSLVFFKATVVGAIHLYGHIYHLEGTVKPSWTGMFG
jgi:hypothetical protein